MTAAWGLPLPPADLSARVAWTLLHSLWQFAAVALLLTFVLAALRNRTPQARYAATCFALAAIFLLPLVTFVCLTRAADPARVKDRAVRNVIVSDGGTLSDFQPVGGSGGDPSAGVSHALWTRTVVRAYLLGVAGFALWNFGGWVAVRRMRHLATSPVPPNVLARFQHLANALRIRVPVALMRSALVASPVALGWLRPLVLVPASALSGLTPAQLDAILAHELAHVRRYDYFVNLLQTVAETLLFYHPAVWWVSRRMRVERELCCDDVAAELTGGDRVSYADALVALEALRGPAPGFEIGPPVLAVGACDGGLVSRVKRLVGAPETPGSWRRSIAIFLAGVAVPILLAAAGVLSLPAPRRAPPTNVTTAPSVTEAEEAERERQSRPILRMPKLRDFEAIAMRVQMRLASLTASQPADDHGLDDTTIFAPLLSAVRCGQRLLDETRIPAGSRRLIAAMV